VKAVLNGLDERRRSPRAELTAQQMVDGVLDMTKDWEYVAVSVGVPGPVKDGSVIREPVNLGKAGGLRSRDGVRQADEGHQRRGHAGPRELRQGPHALPRSRHGLGTTLIVDGCLVAMEVQHMPFRKGTFEDYVGERGLERLGHKQWRKACSAVLDVYALRSQPTTSCSEAGTHARWASCPRIAGSDATRTRSWAASALDRGLTRT
jgi:hypothetical protein